MKCVVLCCAVAMIAPVVPSAFASNLVTDGSFEDNVLAGVFDGNGLSGVWVEQGVFVNNQQVQPGFFFTGFVNSGVFVNAFGKSNSGPDGDATDQAAFLVTAGTGLPQTSITQVTGSQFTAGLKYTLSGVFGESTSGPVTAGMAMEMALGYFADPNTFVDVAVVEINDTHVDPIQFSPRSIDEHMINPGDAAVGMDIAVRLREKAGGVGGGFFEIDEISLTQTPEPTSMALLAIGGLAAAWRRRV